jgi:hypothetical protein
MAGTSKEEIDIHKKYGTEQLVRIIRGTTKLNLWMINAIYSFCLNSVCSILNTVKFKTPHQTILS